VGIRRLFPFIDLTCERRRFRLLDRNGKTVCWATLERCGARKKGGRTRRPLSERISLEPVKGYRSAVARVARVLEDELGLESTGPGLLEEALETLRVSTPLREPAASARVEADTSTGEAVSHLFAEQLRVMEANLEGICRDYDPEFLHDYRIALRKTRSLLGRVKALVPPDDLQYFRDELAWLSRSTGPARDADVYVLGFADIQGSLPGELSDDLAPFLDVLRRKRKDRHQALVQALRSRRYRTLTDRWACFVDEIGASPGEAWQRPVRDLAARQIRKMHKRLLREGDALTEESGDEDYHELRKTCKKLRYLMEFFRPALDEARITGAIKKLKRLQDHLGAFQDCSTQIATFRRYGEEMQASGEHSAATVMALGVLVQGLEREKRARMRGFRRRFDSFPRRAVARALGGRGEEGSRGR
jgi:CHAD domain-containing protein